MRQLRRFQRSKGYQRLTIDKHGQEVVKPFEKDDFNKIIRYCLNKRDKFHPDSKYYYAWYRNYILFILGVNVGNRIETLLELTPRDIAGGKYTVTEMKTGKTFQCDINEDVYQIVKKYIDKYDVKNNEYIFRSLSDNGFGYPITRVQAWKIIKKIAKACKIPYEVGCHSLRKSFARWFWDETHDLLTTQKLLQHSSSEQTMRYIMLEEADVQEVRSNINHTRDWTK